MRNKTSKLEKLIDKHGLRLVHVGALSRLWIACQREGGSIPAVEHKVYDLTHCRTLVECDAVDEMLDQFYRESDGRYFPTEEVR
jgi:hypothetical protein